MAKKKREVKKRPTVIDPKIRKFADKFGIEFRVGPTPVSVDIRCPDIPKSIMACYFNHTGVVFVRDEVPIKDQANLNFMLCHELAHAIHDFFDFGGKISPKNHEDFANSGALIIMAILGLPVSKVMLKNIITYTKGRKLYRKFEGTM